jgi:riboflavin synthase
LSDSRESDVFTGIVEETGTVRELRFINEGAVITISAKTVMSGLKVGDSISVNGVCLTVTHIGSSSFSCDISVETLRRSSFNQIKQGVQANLERSLMLGDRLGGHFVQGHVDGVGRLVAKTPSGEGFEMEFDFPLELERYLVYKGSIAVNGISLTISALRRESFSVAVIPHTSETTNLNQLKLGDAVNLEVDILGKYFERFFQLGILQNDGPSFKLTAEYLKSQGF